MNTSRYPASIAEEGDVLIKLWDITGVIAGRVEPLD